MTSVKFFADGFRISGHSSQSCDDLDGKLVCAAVSSAAFCAANTIIEIIGDECEAQVDDALMEIRVKGASEKSKAVLEGLKLHLKELSEQSGNNINFTEV